MKANHLLFGFFAFVLFASPAFSQQSQPDSAALMTYQIGAVPNLTAWAPRTDGTGGDTLKLAFVMSADTDANGNLNDFPDQITLGSPDVRPPCASSFDIGTGSHIFYYIPTTCEEFPFRLTIIGTKGSTVVSQTFVLTPEQHLQPETPLVGLSTQSTWPDAIANWKQFSSFSYVYDTNLDALNFRGKTLHLSGDTARIRLGLDSASHNRIIIIAGQKIQIVSGGENDYYDRTNRDSSNPSLADVDTISIFADTLEVSSAWHLPEACLTIKAHVIQFDNAGSIDVTPLQNPNGNNTNLPGWNSRTMTIDVDTIIGTPGLRFIANGGAGSNATGTGAAGNGGSGGVVNINSSSYFSWIQNNGGQPGTGGSPGTPGGNGSVNMKGSNAAWVSPLAEEMVVLFAKEAYLRGYDTFVSYYTQLHSLWISAFLQSSDAATLDSTSLQDLNASLSELNTLQKRVSSGLDYFGNPPGWIPMLSFETEIGTYQSAVSSGINAMWLNYSLGSEDSMEVADTASIKSAEFTIAEQMQTLFQQMYQDQLKIDTTKAKLQADSIQAAGLNARRVQIEQALAQQAQQEVQNAHKKSFFQQVMGVCAVIVAICPFDQPLGAALYAGFNLLSQVDLSKGLAFNEGLLGNALLSFGEAFGGDEVSSLLNTGSFSDDILANTGLSNPLDDMEGDIGKISDDFNNGVDLLTNPGDLGDLDNVITLGTNLYSAGDSLYNDGKTLVNDGQDFLHTADSDVNALESQMKNAVVGTDEVSVDYQNLRAANPELNEIIDTIAVISVRRQAEAQLVMALTQQMLNDLNQVNASCGTEVALDGKLQKIDDVLLSARARSFLKQIDQQARENIMRYAYYVAKSYEYRFLQPYTQLQNPFSLTGEYITLAQYEDTAQKILNEKTYASIMTGILEAPITALAESVDSSFLVKYDPLTHPPADTTVTIPSKNIRDLNRYGQTTVALYPLVASKLGVTADRATIDSIGIQELYTSGTANQNGNLQFFFYQNGTFMMDDSAANLYAFKYYANPGSSIFWETQWDPSGAITNLLPDESEDQALFSALNWTAGAAPPILTYAKPGLMTDITISVLGNEPQLHIDSIKLKVNYGDHDNGMGATHLVVDANDELLPYVKVLQPDASQRQASSGRPPFIRLYSNPQELITLVASHYCGNWIFNGWRSADGSAIQLGFPGEKISGDSIWLEAQEKYVMASYILPVNYDSTKTDTVHAGSGISVKMGGFCTTTFDSIQIANGLFVQSLEDSSLWLTADGDAHWVIPNSAPGVSIIGDSLTVGANVTGSVHNLTLLAVVNFGGRIDTISHQVYVPEGVSGVTPSQAMDSLSLVLSPNPTNGAFDISFELPTGEDAHISIFNLLGQNVAQVVNQYEPQGSHTISVYNKQLGLASGSYIVRMDVGGITKMVNLDIQK